MLLLLAPALAASSPDLGAEPPSGALTWRGGRGSVVVAAPPGEHVAPDAPATLRVGDLLVELRGDPSGLAFPLAAGPVAVEASFALCVDGGTACRPARLIGEGLVGGRSGRLALGPPTAHVVAGGAGAAVRLLDFAAVWCPPCNLMAAEVFDAPEHADLVATWPIERIDVDLPASWSAKARYAVGGYPTLIAVDADGAEVARLVGYPGEDATVGWLQGLGTVVPLHRLEAGEGALTPAEAASAARRLAEAEKPDAARRWLDRAEDGVDLRVARLRLGAQVDDATWLLDHAAPPGPWLFDALAASPALWPRIAPLAASLPAADAADVLALCADAMPDADAARAARAGALALLATLRTGDPELDRGHVTTEADLYAGLGRLPDGLALLDRYATLYPGEFTFDHTAARLLLDAGRAQDAEARARVALSRAWGDQRLRAVQVLAKALAAQGRTADAITALDEVQRTTERPPADLAVRTHRYWKQVEALRVELAGK